ncbi:UbiA-like polyprenyltransferase [Paenactinomyces guangxiensis]|uniref:4-hydroxybenzoate polyprenyltransferase n=1 Tax=Paenactinomyces guangxiensis TaxID=1490290 RepID=A0A7W2AA52_9BACL|nr:UbiA-like polyprenyltransferase [Paenactinomyces guangxiensis]MBA4495603.1 UbiA family prenyltransferase [Paenactinomyces guangxiensis]MBH8592591.1 UbiA family prenyltransferase [Paenactinomyces guangxiensis]
MNVLKKLQIILEMIKFEHTIFALPFAYLGAVLGSLEVNGHLPSWGQIGWITLAMVGARSAAMALNRLIDRHIDAKNPRTKNRAIPAGLVSVPFVWGFVVVSFALLYLAASQLNDLAVKLMPIAVFFLVLYSYTKRFTWTCHLILGIATGLGPLGGWVGTTGQVDLTAILLFVTVALWIGGFDVIYACQDVNFDKKEGLYSIPVRFGIRNALIISSLMHLGTAAGLISLLLLTQLQLWFGIGVFIALAILIYEHLIISADDLSRLNTAFFTMNGVLSVIVFVFTMADVLL